MGERHTCFMCTMQTTNDPLAMCDQCDEDARKSTAQAKATARAEGYAEGRAAERADMLAFVEEACRLGTQGDALLRALMARGKHDGAAAIWHSKGYAECQSDVVAYLRRIAGTSALTATTFAASRIDAGAHVGAAKKGRE